MNLKLLQQTPPWEWPKNAGSTLHTILTSKQAKPDDRVIAADLAGDLTVIDDSMAGTLLTIVQKSDEPDKLRATAAIALGPVLDHANTMGFDDPDDVPITLRAFVHLKETLHEIYLDESGPKEVRRRILEASVRAQEDWHRDAIAEAYASGDRDWKLTAVFCMQYVRGFDKQIIESLGNPDLEIQAEAVTAAGNFEIDSAWPRIVKLIDRRTPKNVLIAAIGAVAALRPREAGPLLVDFTHSKDREIAEAVEEAMMAAEVASGSEEEDDEEFFDEDEEKENGWVN